MMEMRLERNAVMAHRRLCSTAHHEAWHAVAAYLFGLAFTFATIRPAAESAGHVEVTIPLWVKRARRSDPGFRLWVDSHVMVQMAGFLAESDYLKRGNHKAAASDYAGTDELAKLVTFGIRERLRYLDWLYERTRAVTSRRQFRRAVKAFADALLQHHTVSGTTRRRAHDPGYPRRPSYSGSLTAVNPSIIRA